MKIYVLLLSVLLLFIISCGAKSNNEIVRRWDFDNLDEWRVYSQDDNPNSQVELNDGIMKIWTRKESLDRKKVATIETFTSGRYKWRTYIKQPGVGDRASVGSWIYCDDRHEIDFEVGYGKAVDRAMYGAQSNEILAWMTTQANPFSSIAFPIEVGWHDFEIDLSLIKGKYFVKWFIDGVQRHSVQQTFGADYKFSIHCSVENLNFIGDNPATQDNYGLFDYVEFKSHN